MWTKLILAGVLGFALGTVTTTLLYRSLLLHIGEVAAETAPSAWSSAGKEWSKFAEWLKRGGRMLNQNGAFTQTKHGMSEDEVRSALGPPDLVVVGKDELKLHRAVDLKGAGGAYFYKIGRFASSGNEVFHHTFAIVFDPSGRVIYRLGQGFNSTEPLADIDTDTRSDRRIAAR